MPLTKSRIPVVIGGLILLLGSVLALVGVASADNATNPFGDNVSTSTDVGWKAYDNTTGVTGDTYGVDVALNTTLAGQVGAIEVFLKPTDTGTLPAFTLSTPRNTAFPTGQGQVIQVRFSFSQISQSIRAAVIAANLSPMVQIAGIHLESTADASGNRVQVRVSNAPTDTALLTPPVVVQPPAPAPTPVPTTIVPITGPAPIPAGGASVVVQPNAAATLTMPDGSVTIGIPVLASNTTFQLVIAPLTTGAPAASPNTKVLHAFTLDAYDAAGNKQASFTFLNSITITAKYTSADAQASFNGNPTNLRVLTYDALNNQWDLLSTTVDLAGQTLAAQTSHLSTFAVGSANPSPQTVGTPTATPVATPTPTPTVAPTATPTPKLPPTGDFAPSSGLVMGIMLISFLMLLGGGAYLVQSRKSKV